MATLKRLRQSAGFESWGQLRRKGREVVRSGVDSFRGHDLMSYASAISFQVVFAVIPLTLAAVALLGFLGLEEVWRDDVAPRVRDSLSADAFVVVDQVVERVLGEKRVLWLTFGIAFALWQISGAVRATMTPLNAVYDIEEERPWWRRYLVSFALAVDIAVLVLGAALLIQLGPRLVRALGLPGAVEWILYVARWGVAVAALTFAVWLLLRYAPARSQTFAWAGLGSVFVVGSWLVASVGFAFYAAKIASYGSVFGNLASVIVLLTYVYISSAALLFGIQLDACVRMLAQKPEQTDVSGSRAGKRRALSGARS